MNPYSKEVLAHETAARLALEQARDAKEGQELSAYKSAYKEVFELVCTTLARQPKPIGGEGHPATLAKVEIPPPNPK